ncbi:MAG: hypothetical protein WBZ36_17065 [Candidatus Nitrosopolaris sp.]
MQETETKAIGLAIASFVIGVKMAPPFFKWLNSLRSTSETYEI